jgi:HSP20 family protein
MKLITWNPITRPVSIFNDLDNLFNNFGDFTSIVDQRSSWKPRFEVLNTDATYCIRAELPGMSKKDINIELEDNVLTLSGERKWNDKDDNNYSEFSYGNFLRSFNLPEDVKENNIKASMKDGVLSIQVPRLEKVKPEVKKIAIK